MYLLVNFELILLLYCPSSLSLRIAFKLDHLQPDKQILFQN